MESTVDLSSTKRFPCFSTFPSFSPALVNSNTLGQQSRTLESTETCRIGFSKNSDVLQRLRGFIDHVSLQAVKEFREERQGQCCVRSSEQKCGDFQQPVHGRAFRQWHSGSSPKPGTEPHSRAGLPPVDNASSSSTHAFCRPKIPYLKDGFLTILAKRGSSRHENRSTIDCDYSGI
nr:hypothetical protein CFP56_02907 [Quercus suber]